MKKVFKYILLSIISLWLLFTSFVTYRFFSNSWTEFKFDENKFKRSHNPIWTIGTPTTQIPFIKRISSCNENYILEFISLERQLQNLKVDVKSGLINEGLINQFKIVYDKWPDGLKRFSENHISNVFIVKNLGSSGYTFTANDSSFIIFINEDILKERPNDWFNRTEGDCIQNKGSSFLINHLIEDSSNNSPVYTLENILIHEVGHCVGVVEGLTPTFDRKIRLPNELNFYDGTYDVQLINLELKSPYSEIFTKLKYYSPEKLTFNEYSLMLDELSNSPFPTTYSTQGQLEFFAEYFYSYIHCILQKRPFEYRFINNNRIIKSVGNGIYNQNNKSRYLLIEKTINEL